MPVPGAVQQQALLPTHADPKLWTVETRGGSAREACIKLMQKAINKAEAGEPLLIRSVFYQEHLKVGPADLWPCCVNRRASLFCHAVGHGCSLSFLIVPLVLLSSERLHMCSAEWQVSKLSFAYHGLLSVPFKKALVVACIHYCTHQAIRVVRAVLQGYIYVEAYKESHVKEAIRGLTCLFYGKGGQLVPMKEMVDAITVKSTAKGSNIGATPCTADCNITLDLFGCCVAYAKQWSA